MIISLENSISGTFVPSLFPQKRYFSMVCYSAWNPLRGQLMPHSLDELIAETRVFISGPEICL
jgi:hypothetical protein